MLSPKKKLPYNRKPIPGNTKSIPGKQTQGWEPLPSGDPPYPVLEIKQPVPGRVPSTPRSLSLGFVPRLSSGTTSAAVSCCLGRAWPCCAATGRRLARESRCSAGHTKTEIVLMIQNDVTMTTSYVRIFNFDKISRHLRVLLYTSIIF